MSVLTPAERADLYQDLETREGFPGDKISQFLDLFHHFSQSLTRNWKHPTLIRFDNPSAGTDPLGLNCLCPLQVVVYGLTELLSPKPQYYVALTSDLLDLDEHQREDIIRASDGSLWASTELRNRLNESSKSHE